MIVMVNNGAVIWTGADGSTVPTYVSGTQLSLSAANWTQLLAAPKLTSGLMPDPRTVSGIAASVWLTPLEFLALFTAAEQAAIMKAALATPTLMLWLLQAMGASYVDLGSATTAAGLAAMVAAGLLTAAREAQVLANTPPAS